jgi:hypothetical protein
MLALIAAALLAADDGGMIETTSQPLGTTPAAAPALNDSPYDEGPADAGEAAPPTPVPAAGAPEPIPAVATEGDAAPTPPPVGVGEAVAPSEGFVKGELSVYLGSDRLTVKNNRIGVSAGVEQFGSAYFALIEPQVDLRFWDAKWAVGVGVPLRIELVSFEDEAEGAPTKFLGRIRKEDWDSFHDFGRLLKYINYGRKEDNLYVNIGQRYASTIGHGALMRRYAPNIDIDYPRASAEVDAYNDFGGFEVFVNDILAWNQLAGIAFIKPLWFLHSQNILLKSLSIGVSGATDWQAPLTLKLDTFGARQVSINDRRLLTNDRPVGLFGFDAEVKVYKDDHFDVKPYVDYSLMVNGDAGLTIGVLARINVGTSIVNAFRVVGEVRVLGNRYQPSYFDTFYEVERVIANFDETAAVNGAIQYRTKQDLVLSQGLGSRAGYYLEGSWGIRGAIGFTASIEGTSNSSAKNFVAHLEVPVLSFLQIFGSYYKRGFLDFKEFGTFDQHSVLFAGARLKVLPFFFINGRAYKTFRVNPASQRYDNSFGFLVDLEIGYEFGGKKESPMPTGNTPATEQAPAT